MPDTDQWEARELGASEAYVKPSTLDGVDEAPGLKAISIRLQTSMIDDLKAIAARDGIQPLIKRVLARFIEEERRPDKPRTEMTAIESAE